jgi:hypothetical protein
MFTHVLVALSKIDRPEPIKLQALTEAELPSVKLSRTDKHKPSLPAARTDKALANRKLFAMDSLWKLLTLSSPKTLQFEDNLMHPRKLQHDAQLTNADAEHAILS